MEMEDQHHHHQYNMPDLRQLLNGRPTPFQPIPQQDPDLFSSGAAHYRNLRPPQPGPHPQQHHFDMMQMVVGTRQVGGHNYHELMPRGLHYHDFPNSDSTPNNNNIATPKAAAAVTASASTPTASCGGFDGETAAFCGGDGGTGRWPRQETLTLLEIRSRLDPKFKEANQKGPLWDEVSRIMSEEHGYQRSGKKCREKFENLYKYYKKTKEGKAGRQDGKHYRFFRQLEALYGETSNSAVSGHEIGNNFRFHGTPNSNIDQKRHHQDVYHTQKLICDNSLSLSNSSEFEPSSSDDDDNDLSTADQHHAAMMMENDSSEKQRKKKRGNWKAKIKEFIDSQMRKLVERQEAWLEKLTKTLEEKEKERIKREEEWRKEEAERMDREHKFWAKERAWIEARDAALMESLQNLTGNYKQCLIKGSTTTSSDDHQMQNDDENYQNDDEIDGISENINKKKKESNHYNKKRKDNNSIRASSSGYYANNVEESGLYSASQGRGAYCEGSSPSNSNAANNNIVGANDSCFRFLMADGENNNLWENYGLKLSKGDQNQ